MSGEIEKLEKSLEDNLAIDKKVLALTRLSKLYGDRHDYKRSKEYIDTAYTFEKDQILPLTQAHIYHAHAHLLFSSFDINSALTMGYKALQIFRESEDKIMLSRSQNLIGVIYSSLDLTEKSLEFYLNSSKNDPTNIAPVQNCAQKYLILGDYQNAETFINKAIDMSRDQKADDSLTQSYLILADIYKKVEKIDEAIETYSKAEEIQKSTGNMRHFCFINLGKGTIAQLNRDYESAKELFNKIGEKIDLSKNIELNWFTLTCFKNLYKELEDYKNLSDVLEQLLEIRMGLEKSKFGNRIKELETAYEIQKKELEYQQILEKSQRLASIGVMAAGITHEINQPLNSISINSQMILFKNRKEDILPPEYSECISEINRGVDRINDIISHMRTFWNYPDYKEEGIVNINDIIHSSVDLIRQQIRSHGIELKLTLLDQSIDAKIHQIHLEQILINLMVNSIHSLDESSGVDKLISIDSTKDDRYGSITLRDNGKGFKSDDLEKIYEPFYSTKSPDKGMGLGLAIVKTYVEKMDGEINHGNNEDGGAYFEIKIPLGR